MALTQEVLAKILERAQVAASKQASRISRAPVEEAPDDGDVPVGIHGILASTEKLLAVNRGLVPPDERDSLQFKRLYTTEHLLRERVALDADKVRLNVLRRAAKTKNLEGMHASIFDPYVSRHIVGNPLAMPGEEINPLALVEQARRITQMGPGGLGSTQAITAEAQNVHPSQFGFISSLEGPESERVGIDTRLAWGAKIDPVTGKIYQRMYDNHQKRHRWLTPGDLEGAVMQLPE